MAGGECPDCASGDPAARGLFPEPTGAGPWGYSESECRSDWHDAPHAFRGPHCGHDVGMRHDGAGLVSSTCYDCGVRYSRPARRGDTVRTLAEFNALPKGTRVLGFDGKVYTRDVTLSPTVSGDEDWLPAQIQVTSMHYGPDSIRPHAGPAGECGSPDCVDNRDDGGSIGN